MIRSGDGAERYCLFSFARTVSRHVGFSVILLSLFGLAPVLVHAQTPQRHNPQAQTHRDKGDKLHASGNNPGALKEYQAAYALDKVNPIYARDMGTDLRKIGNAHLDQGQSQQAISYYQQALTIARQTKDQQGQADALNNLGNDYLSLNHGDDSIRYYQQALTLYQQIKDKKGQARTLNNLGVVCKALSRYDQAIEFYEKALTLNQQTNDLAGQAMNLCNLGVVYDTIGQSETAITVYQQALTIDQQTGDRDGQAKDLGNLGVVYLDLSQFDKALDYAQQALAIDEQINDSDEEAKDLGNLGNVYTQLGQYEKAIGFFQQALAIDQQIKDSEGEAETDLSLGVAYDNLHQYEKASASYQQVLAIDTEIKDIDGQANSLNNLGNVYTELSQYEKAIGFYQQALTIHQQTKDLNGQAEDLNNLGLAYTDLDQPYKAIGLYQQALVIHQQTKDLDGQAVVLTNLMDVWRHHDDRSLAIFYGKQLINIYQSVRYDIRKMDKPTQKDYLKSKESAYRYLGDLLIQMRRFPEAVQVLNMLKQEEYLNFAQDRHARTMLLAERVQMTPSETKWNMWCQTAADSLILLRQQSQALQDKSNPTPAETALIKALDTKITVATRQLEKTVQDIVGDAGQISDSEDLLEAQADATKLQQTLTPLGHHSVAIYTLAGDNGLTTLLITPTQIIANSSPITSEDLDTKINAFRAALQDPTVDPRPLGKQLYDLLVKPMEADLKAAHAQTLMWSLDGNLRYIPIAALYDGQQYMVEKYTNTLFTPASDTQISAEPQAHWTGLGLGVSQPHPGFLALTNVPAELDSVIHDPNVSASGQGALPGTILLDGQFTKAALMTSLAHHDPLVHIASHFAFQPGDAKDSYLLLGDGSHLSLADIQAMPDDLLAGVNLLTLSACETAADGAGANGKEVENLAVLAQRKGAAAVMATLWSVDDLATQQLMRSFYSDRQSGAGMSKGDALRQAQLSILGDADLAQATASRGQRAHIVPDKKDQSVDAPPYLLDKAHPQVHPYFWAPFILIGNWK